MDKEKIAGIAIFLGIIISLFTFRGVIFGIIGAGLGLLTEALFFEPGYTVAGKALEFWSALVAAIIGLATFFTGNSQSS